MTHENSSRQTDSRDLCKAAVEDPAFSAARATELSGQSECVASVGSLLKEYRCTMLHRVAPCCTYSQHAIGDDSYSLWGNPLLRGQTSKHRPQAEERSTADPSSAVSSSMLSTVPESMASTKTQA